MLNDGLEESKHEYWVDPRPDLWTTKDELYLWVDLPSQTRVLFTHQKRVDDSSDPLFDARRARLIPHP